MDSDIAFHESFSNILGVRVSRVRTSVQHMPTGAGKAACGYFFRDDPEMLELARSVVRFS